MVSPSAATVPADTARRPAQPPTGRRVGGRSSSPWLYLAPTLLATLAFVVLPMLYTLGIGFTNRSSTNLLSHDEARARLLDESIAVPGSIRAFTLHPDGGRWRLRLTDPATGRVAWSESVALDSNSPQPRDLAIESVDESDPRGPLGATASSHPSAEKGSDIATLHAVVDHLQALRGLTLVAPDGTRSTLLSLREFAVREPLYDALADGALRDRVTGTTYRVDAERGFYADMRGEVLQPGFVVNVGAQHYRRIATDPGFREPFVSVLAWTVSFAALSVVGAAALGLLLACLLEWQALRFRSVYRVVLFLPYAVPGFLSILIFKGLFNQNLGEVNAVLHGLFGIRPAWFSDPWLARAMLLLVNIWLGFPYMMVLCSGLLKSIPEDLREASAEAGAGPLTHFRYITLPLILKPLTPLLIAAFAFNFNNFVLVSLLTGGRPDHAEAVVPAGMTDVLVSYTWRIAFADSGQQYGLAAAISTLIFVLVALITLVQLRVGGLRVDTASGQALGAGPPANPRT
jgi:maltose/maltodextrin transport system permease protein